MLAILLTLGGCQAFLGVLLALAEPSETLGLALIQGSLVWFVLARIAQADRHHREVMRERMEPFPPTR
jgi:hypothetical protein